jgi:hypothetical protein
MPMRGELPPARARSSARVSALPATSTSVRTTIFTKDLQLIAALSAIGYLTALNVMLRFPDICSLLAAYSIY